MLTGVDISPELTQAAYLPHRGQLHQRRHPFNPYFVAVLAAARKCEPSAGLGTLIAAMAPYSVSFLVVWTALLLVWVGLGIPLGSGGQHRPPGCAMKFAAGLRRFVILILNVASPRLGARRRRAGTER